MNRRAFIKNTSIATSSIFFFNQFESLAVQKSHPDLYSLFKNPPSPYRPFVRWWWNGNKVKKEELFRQLALLKDAGIGGVEINPISFPGKADDMGIKSLRWLSDEWINIVRDTCQEAKSKEMTCDLLVGSGWPFGSEDLKEEERGEVLLVFAEKVEGPMVYETNKYSIYSSVDPQVTDKNPLRSPTLLNIKLSPDPVTAIETAIDFSNQINNDIIRIDVPEGKHCIYAVVRFKSFAKVINGAPGASGAILNHLNKKAVEDYLNRMSSTIQGKIGPLSNYLRALFTDSMELEGCNWCDDFPEEFKKRCGYDLMPYLPFIMFKVGRLGAVVDVNYGAKKSPELSDILRKVRFDFEYTKAILLRERFTEVYLNWCKKLQVKSRAQAYGRGFFPLETSLGYDIPEGESWTTNYLRHKLGEEMPDDDYRRGRGYTMINKYVSSAAHLAGNRMVSCEEMTNTYQVFNETLELLKLGSDQSIMSGITHSIWHGFNYSPKEAAFPGWVQYGSYYNEKNNWWPFFKYLNDYKARLSSQLQNGTYYSDIAILPANYDLWANNGVQTDPFPELLNVPYTSLLWEAIHKNGGAADYITDMILSQSEIKKGKIVYGKKSFGTLFLPAVESLSELAIQKIEQFVKGGGKVICIEKYPSKGLGFLNWQQKDLAIQTTIDRLKTQFADRFILIDKPSDHKFLEWYSLLVTTHQLPTYLKIASPNRYFMQVRYQRDDGSEMFFFQNAHRYDAYEAKIIFDRKKINGKYAWIWDLDTGERFRLKLTNDTTFEYNFGPTASLLLIFDDHKDGEYWKPLPHSGKSTLNLDQSWNLELLHSLDSSVKNINLDQVIDMKDHKELVNFSGKAIYRKQITLTDRKNYILNLGRVYGITLLYVNQKQIGIKWYGRRVFDISKYIQKGVNEIEIHLVTTMGNYMKTLTGNEVAQHWVNRKGREQEIQSMGIVGPIEIYEQN
ncbi:glycosyl hydrolase [Pedobacter sp.]|uniref:glycosyl hydrolase n=1 Tax=Pedobacter sp. TaxID=1411316 RepID=UPI003D7FF817